MDMETPQETQARCDRAGAEFFGDRLEFRAGGASVERKIARGIFEKHGLAAALPADPKPDTALSRAMREGRKPKGYLTKKFVSPNADTPLAIHITKVGAGHGEAGDEYTCHARVRVSHRVETDPVTGADITVPFAVAKPPEGQSEFTDVTARDRAIAIAQQANHLLSHAENKDLGAWLRAALESLFAVQSLGKGNNYNVPRRSVETAHAILIHAPAHQQIACTR